jgi:hypothetical protein
LGRITNSTTGVEYIKTLKRRGQEENSVDSNDTDNQASAVFNARRAMGQVKASRHKGKLDKPNEMCRTGKEPTLDDASSSEEESQSTSSISIIY